MPDDALQDALATLQRFLDANDRRDVDAMRACLTQSSLSGFSGEGPADVRYDIGTPVLQGERVIIPMRVSPRDGGPDAPVLAEMPCVMVQEDGAWKFDLAATMAPQEAMMEQALREMGQQIGQAMEQMGKAIGSALDGSADGQTPPQDPQAQNR